ncbi:MAG: hypothetical protein JSS49_23445 [Planctomycetes bacterium]|nr:hypothetical protein [Planctomycetota bacterium]
MPHALRASRVMAGLVLALGITYLFFCIRPVWHTDVWGHLSYGRLIWETRSLPATEPLMPLARGVDFVDTAWLSQILGYVTMKTLGIAGLQGLYAISVTICTSLLVAQTYRTTRHGWFSLLAMVSFLVIAWSPLAIIRPQMAGLACFVMLLTRVSSRRLHRSDWLLIPLLFTVWANLHGSFMIGLFLLGSVTIGRAFDLFRRTGSVSAILRDHRSRRNLLLLELACAAVLLNPYGIGIYTSALQIASNPNLNDLIEWHPLGLKEARGTIFGTVAIALAILYRSSPRRVRSWEVLALVVLGWSALTTSRMLVWWAPVAALLLAIHGHAVWRRWRRQPVVGEAPVRAGKWTVVVVGLIWIFFAYSPLGVRLVHGKVTRLERVVSPDTPLAVVEYLRMTRPQSQIFNTYEWGDFLQWAGPGKLKVFVNSHAHLVPRDVWQAYMQISEAQTGWEETLDRYGVNVVVVDNANRAALIKKLKENDKWWLDFEQDGQVVFVRRNSI